MNAVFADTEGFATPGHAVLLVLNRIAGFFKVIPDITIQSIQPGSREVARNFLLALAKRFE